VNAIARAGSKAQRQDWLPAIAAGERIAAFAYAEPQGRYDLADLTTTAKAADGGYRLNGHKVSVIGAPMASHLLVSARTSGVQREARGITLFAIPKSIKGISARDYRAADGMRASDITFESTQLTRDHIVGEEGNGLALIEQLADEAIAALCAEAT